MVLYEDFQNDIGLVPAIEGAGITIYATHEVEGGPVVWMVSDLDAAKAIVASHNGVPYAKMLKMQQLNEVAAIHFDVFQWASNGTAHISGDEIASVIADLINNFRSKRSAIAEASSISDLDNIDIHSAWHPNP